MGAIAVDTCTPKVKAPHWHRTVSGTGAASELLPSTRGSERNVEGKVRLNIVV